jgi:hypothetical protein
LDGLIFKLKLKIKYRKENEMIDKPYFVIFSSFGEVFSPLLDDGHSLAMFYDEKEATIAGDLDARGIFGFEIFKIGGGHYI